MENTQNQVEQNTPPDVQENTPVALAPIDEIDVTGTAGIVQDDYVPETFPTAVNEPETQSLIAPTAEDIVVSEAPAQQAPVDELETNENGDVIEQGPYSENVFIEEGRSPVAVISDPRDYFNSEKITDAPSLDQDTAERIMEKEIVRLVAENPNVKQSELVEQLTARSMGQFRHMFTDFPVTKELNGQTASREREWRQHHNEIPSTRKGFVRMDSAPTPNSRIANAEESAEYFGRANNLHRKVRVVCENSGVVVILKTPDDLSLLIAEDQISQNKMEAGYLTFGMSYANSSVYVAEVIWDLIQKHIVRTSIDPTVDPNVDLGDVFTVFDLPILTAGLTAAAYPEGHRFVRTVFSKTGDATKRRQIVETVAPLRTVLTDYKSMLPYHLEHLKKSSHTVAEIQKYQDLLIGRTEKAVALSDSTSINFKVPTINEWIAAGKAWLSGIETAIKVSATASNMNDLRRRQLFHGMIEMTQLREYSHWIKRINDTTGAGVYVDGHKEIYHTLDVLSKNQEIRQKLIEAVIAFKGSTAVSITAVPVASDETNEMSRFKGYVEYDPMSAFFTLLGQRKA